MRGHNVNKVSSKFLLLLILGSILFACLPNIIAKAVVNNSFVWTTLQGDAQRTGYTESPSPDNNQTFWVFQTGGAIRSSPVVVAGMVFVGSTDGYLYAVNATTGSKLWEFWVGTDVNSPTVAHGKVFITSKSGNVFAVDMQTGLEVWSESLGEEAGFGAPLVVGTRVLVNGNQTVFAFNEAVGVTLYEEVFVHAQGIAPLAYSNIGELIIGVTSRGEATGVKGFEVKDAYGRFWVTLFDSGSSKNLRSGATIDNDTFFVVTPSLDGNSILFAFDSLTIQLWEQPLDGVTEASPAIAYNTIYIPTSKFTYAINKNDGTVKWSRPVDSEYAVLSPAVADGKVYFGLNNYIYALNAFNGNPIWSYESEGNIQSSPAISDGLLFVGSDDGNLYAIGTPTIQSFNAGTWDDITYYVSIHSNSTVANFLFTQSLKQISFDIEGQSGTTGFCNVTIPKNLLDGPYAAMADESQPLEVAEQSNDSHNFLYFSYSHSLNTIRIEGTEVIPEFQTWILVMFVTTLTVTLFVYKRKLAKTLNR